MSASRTASAQLLREIVHEVYANLRGGDLVFVCDSETLACLLSEGDEDAAGRAGERILKAVLTRLGERLEWTVVRLPQQGSTLAGLLSGAQESFSTPKRVAS